MRIAVLTEYYPNHDNPASGVYVHVRTAAYVKRGEDVRVYLVRNGELRYDSYEGVPVVAGAAETIRAEIERFGPNVIALHTPYPGVPHTRVAESLAIPRVVWIHGYETLITALYGYHSGLARVFSILHDLRKVRRLKRALTGAAAVVYVSDWFRRVSQRTMAYSHPKSMVIPNPVDTRLFRPRDETRTNGHLRGIALRPLRRVQGLDVAVRAFVGVDDSPLNIVGTGPEAETLKGLISRLDSPVELEERSVPHERVPELLAGFDYFVAPSRSATQCLAMTEAMACGMPVIATRVGGIPEFARDGIDGYLVSVGDSAALRRAVRELIRDPDRAKEMGRNAREQVEANFSVERVIPQELEILAGALKT